jgi:hypothetical protein
MALAVAEAHRVLRPGGQLIDIHPAGAPLRLELWQARAGHVPADRAAEAFDRRILGDLGPEDMVDDFVESSRAIANAPAHGFELIETVTFDYRFFFDTLDDLTEYLEDNEELDLASDALLEQALHALQQSSAPAQLVLVQPVIATRLHKT